jgi:hypothetical protein
MVRVHETIGYPRLLHTVAIAALVVAPMALLGACSHEQPASATSVQVAPQPAPPPPAPAPMPVPRARG